MNTLYLQVFSMTDHAEALRGRYQGNYQGLNSEIHTSEMDGNSLKISSMAKGPQGDLDRSSISSAKVIVAYRHSDTGVLQGTSETIIPVQTFPWTELPGFEILELFPKEGIRIKLWNQEVRLEPDRVTTIRFMKTIVYLRNYGVVDNILWSDEKLEHGPTELHKEMVDQDLTIAPPGASGIVVKAGQETSN